MIDLIYSATILRLFHVPCNQPPILGKCYKLCHHTNYYLDYIMHPATTIVSINIRYNVPCLGYYIHYVLHLKTFYSRHCSERTDTSKCSENSDSGDTNPSEVFNYQIGQGGLGLKGNFTIFLFM